MGFQGKRKNFRRVRRFTKGYRIRYPETNKIETHRDIIFEPDQQEEASNIESKKQTTVQLG